MVLKAKSDAPIKLIKGESGFSSWRVPELDGGNSKSFRQPLEEGEIEVEETLTEEEEEQLAAEELQAIRDAAYQEGFQSGRDAGLASAKQQIDEQSQLLSNIINQLSEPLSRCGEKTQQELLELAFAVARQIVRRELQQDPTQLIAIIRDSLKLLPIGAENITIALHPEDASIVSNVLNIDGETSADGWQIKGDPSVERGSCQVSTEDSKIDASIDKQIAVLFSKVAGGQRAGENDPER